MSKFFKVFILSFMVIFFTLSSTAYAGSVPEDLLFSDGARVFFGEIIEYHPEKEEMEVRIVENIKGDNSPDSKEIFQMVSPVKTEISLEEVYLIAYYDEVNPTYVFQVTSYDTDNLKLSGAREYDMWQRFQELLNEGRFRDAEAERVRKLGIISSNPVSEKTTGKPALKAASNSTAFSIFMFIIAFIILSVGVLIYSGKTQLIHEYHQRKVIDKKGYGKAFGKAFMGMSVPLIISGIIGLFHISGWIAVILIVGIIIAFIPIVIVQKRYNGGLF